MKFALPKKSLIFRLTDVNGIVEKTTTSPILSHIGIKADEAGLHLLSTDTELTLEANLPASILESGETTVSGDRFTQFVSRLPKECTVQCILEEGQMTIHAGKTQATFMTLPIEDMPVKDETDIEFTTTLQLDAGALYHILDKVRFSMAVNDVRQYLNGLYLNVLEDGRTLEAVTTDGHRLSAARALLEKPVDNPQGYIVPSKTVGALLNQLSAESYLESLQLKKEAAIDVETMNTLNEQLITARDLKKQAAKNQYRVVNRPIELKFSERDMVLAHDDIRMTSRLIDGKFPQYEQIIPELQEEPILIDPVALTDALRRCLVILKQNKNDNGVKLQFSGHQLYISARNLQNETAEEQIDIINSQDINTTIGINAEYLISAVDHLNAEKIQFHVQDENVPCLITATSEPELRYVIMPMRL